MKKDDIKKESLYIKAYQKTLYLKGAAASIAANVERKRILQSVVYYIDSTDKGLQVPAWVRSNLINAMVGAMSEDLRALIPAIPTEALIAAVRVDGSLNVPAIGRYMSVELANNAETATAIALAANEAQKAARHDAQKAAKKAALAAKKAAKKAEKEYVNNNTCGQI